MNKNRRKVIAEISTMLDNAKSMAEGCRDEEQDYLDNMPESIQGSDRGYKAEECVSYLDDAIDAIDTAIENIGYASE